MTRFWIMGGALLLTCLPLHAGNWPEYRGPGAQGHSAAQGLPLTWSKPENIAWSTVIPERGWSSPVIWEDQIWLTTATPDGTRLFALCVDRTTGRIVHNINVFDVESPEHIASMNSYASPSPVIEDGRVYVHYGTYGTACLDTRTAKTIWTRRDLKCDHHEGPGASPILFENLLIMHVDGRDVQYVVALNKVDGKTVWKTNRSVDYSNVPYNHRKCYGTPIVIRTGGRTQLISPTAKAFLAYDPRTGKELWKVRHAGWSITPRPIFGNGLVFLINDYERPELWALRPDGTGDVTDSHIVWKVTKTMPNQPSPLLIGDLLYTVNDMGIAICLEAESGQVVWKERLGGNYSASPIYADGRIYFFNRDGRTTVIQPGRSFKILAVNDLDEELMASPAVADKAIYLRTRTRPYRIENQTARQITGARGNVPHPLLRVSQNRTTARITDCAHSPTYTYCLGNFQGSRYSGTARRAASSSPTIFSVAGSYWIERPSFSDRLPSTIGTFTL